MTSSKDVQHYAEGAYFGELALLYDQPRAATVVAATAVVCATLERGAFERLLGPVRDLMRRDAQLYANYEGLL